MLNEQRQKNDYTAIAPTSLLVAGVRALALDAGNRQLRVRSVLSNLYRMLLFSKVQMDVCDAKDEAFMTMRVIKAPLGALD
jgi:hypothetical protein